MTANIKTVDKVNAVASEGLSSRPHIEEKKKKSVKGKKKNHKTAENKGRPRSHGMSNTSEYRSFYAARDRCTNPNHRQFKDYGGRSIQFRFGSFEEFYETLGPCPSSKSLERMDPDGHYEKGNVCWATRKQQAKNRRTSKQYIAKAARQKIFRNQAARASRKDISRLWNLGVRAYNEGGLSGFDLIEWNHLVERSGIDLPEPKRPNSSDSMIVLPSLTRPGHLSEISLCQPEDGPCHGCSGQGLLDPVQSIPLSMNLTEEWISLLSQCKSMSGAFIRLAPPSELAPTFIPPEAGLLVFGSYFARQERDSKTSTSRGATFLTAFELSKLVVSNLYRELYFPSLLIIPDLQVGCDPNEGMSDAMTVAIADVFKERLEAQNSTIIFAENLQYLGEAAATLIEYAFKEVRLDWFESHALDEDQQNLNTAPINLNKLDDLSNLL